VASWCEQLVTEAGVLLLPGSVYEHAPSKDHFRLGLGRRNLPDCLARLEGWLQQRYPGCGVATTAH
jgi:aspartate/methionine/tyrosine aminotransferase